MLIISLYGLTDVSLMNEFIKKGQSMPHS